MSYKNLELGRKKRREAARRFRAIPGNKERIAAAFKAKRDDPLRWPEFAAYNIKYRARKAGIPFNITAADVAIPALCPVFGVPFKMGAHLHPRSPTVDRLRPELGYVKGNVRVITHRANSIKNDSVSSGEILAVALYMEREGL